MVIPVRYSIVTADLRPRPRLYLDARSAIPGPPFYGVAVWILDDGSIQVSGAGLRLTNAARERLKAALVPDLLAIGQEASRIAVTFDAKTAAVGLTAPFRRIQTTGGNLTSQTFLELGGVGAGMCTFGLDASGQTVLHVPPRPAPYEGRPLAPITAAAQVRWDNNWSPAHAQALMALLGADADAALRHFHAVAARLPVELDFS